MSTTRTVAETTADEVRDAHAYPSDLARVVRERWGGHPRDVDVTGDGRDEAPEAWVFSRLLSACYQASLLREEERPVSFRAIFAAPEDLPEGGGPPDGLHHIVFGEPRPFDERELRRLSPAADFDRSLIGVRRREGGGMEIWGLVHTGPRWLRVVQGGRERAAPLPPVPVVKVAGPGHLVVKRGPEIVAELAGGAIVGSRTDVFPSRWVREYFTPLQDELQDLHRKARREASGRGEAWAPLDPELPRMIARQMYRRLVSILSEARHGGIIVIVPPERAGEMLAGTRVSLKHSIEGGEHRRRFRDLLVGIMNRLARAHGRGGEASYPRAVGWDEYARSEDRELGELDEAIFEFAHLVAGLAAVDGAVVMTKGGELLGFGGEISGDNEPVVSVRKALDSDGETTVPEGVENVGTRHRSAYRLAAAMPDALLVVVSQDGNVRFVADRDGVVTCWDQA